MSHFLHTADLGKLPSDLVRLKGQDNFTRWKRDFKIVAISEGVLDIIEGREPTLHPPHEDDYLSDYPPPATTESTLSVTDLEGLLVDRGI
ncbi:hypothetical protein BDU57DRAFT_540864 [Ampelomyces quisqualis]|uniref:Uncharacterized protein n=1 Tax=Ampelomyces quisqualis TaxID=50730 RepID=A0A6A5QLU8_AMPQU|nr:hypothetical protein BDU57DRAFT_540864 [Ampelomyces quisqualis]